MPVIQRVSSVVILPLANYANGQQTAGPVDIANDVTSVDFNILCNSVAQPLIWPLITTVLDILPEVSTDGGSTWVEAGHSITPGGPHNDKFGNPLQSVLSGGGIPAVVGGVTRKYRVTTTITGGPLRSSVTLEVN